MAAKREEYHRIIAFAAIASGQQAVTIIFLGRARPAGLVKKTSLTLQLSDPGYSQTLGNFSTMSHT